MKAHEVRVVAESVMIDVRTPLPKVQKPTAGFEGKLANYGDNDVPRKDRHHWQRFSGQQSTNYGKDPPRTIAKYLSEDEFHTRTSLLKDGGACLVTTSTLCTHTAGKVILASVTPMAVRIASGLSGTSNWKKSLPN